MTNTGKPIFDRHGEFDGYEETETICDRCKVNQGRWNDEIGEDLCGDCERELEEEITEEEREAA